MVRRPSPNEDMVVVINPLADGRRGFIREPIAFYTSGIYNHVNKIKVIKRRIFAKYHQIGVLHGKLRQKTWLGACHLNQ